MIQSSARNSILRIYGRIQLSASRHWLIFSWSNLPQQQEWSLPVVPTLWHQRRSRMKKSYRISSFRWRGYSLLVSVWLLFEGGVYFIGKPADINDSWTRYIQAIQRRLLDAGSSTRNLSVLLSAMEKSSTTRTALALARWPSSELFVYVCVCHVLLWLLFEGGVWSKKYGTIITMVFVTLLLLLELLLSTKNLTSREVKAKNSFAF